MVRWINILIILILFSCKASMKSSSKNIVQNRAKDSISAKKEPIKEPEKKNSKLFEVAEYEKINVEEVQSAPMIVQGKNYSASGNARMKSEILVVDLTKPISAEKLNESLGEIAYSVPANMQVGQEYRIKIRISKKNADLLDQNKPINQKGIKSIITLENIRVSNVMSATLNGNKDEYHIESNSTETWALDCNNFYNSTDHLVV